MVSTGPQRYPGASTTYWYQDQYPGKAMESSVGVIHTTEGMSVPDYGGGAKAPNFTALPDIPGRRLVWYQHFDFDISSRALRNPPGGVETNTLNAVQIELVGTCDPIHRTSWGSKKAGTDYLYWPDAPDWALAELGKFVRWSSDNHNVKLSSTVTWKAYPGSGGANNGVRLSGSQWQAYSGWLGHQHVPENDHGDPGNLNFARVLEHAKGTAGEINRRVEGRVVDSKGNGIADLAVGVFRQDLHGDSLMINAYSVKDEPFYGYARTIGDGTFVVGYNGGSDDIVIRVFNSIGRQLGPDHGPYLDVTDKLVLQQPIQVGAAELNGRVSTGGAFTQTVAGNAVEPLVDNDAAWKAVYEDILTAEHSIDWMLFYLDVGRVFMTFDDATPDIGVATTGGRLEEALKKVAQDKAVKVRLACNQLTAFTSFALPWPVSTASQVTTAMKDVPNVEVRVMRTPATAPIHAKFVVIDNKVAYLIGSPFVSDYYDNKSHMIADPRHGDFSSCIDSRAIVVPTHDVSLRLRGPAIGQLNETFALHWNTAKPDAPAEPPAPAPGAVGTASLQVVRSLAGNSRYATFPHGEKTVFESYLRAIETATKYIYLENQYFTNEVIADAIVRRLKAQTKLCVIFLTNNKVDIPGYDVLHPQTIRRVLGGLTADERKRVGFFCPWSHEPGSTAQSLSEICRNYIHSKVAIIDDDWITVGSANLDGASLDYSQSPYSLGIISWLFGLQPKGNLHENRETEVNVSLFDQVAGGPATAIAKDVRKHLWAEHLGFANPADTALENPPAGGNWLTLWQRHAETKLNGLKASPITVNPAKILAYPPQPGSIEIPKKAASAKGYLELAGVKVDGLRVWEHFRRFDWGDGQWEDEAL